MTGINRNTNSSTTDSSSDVVNGTAAADEQFLEMNRDEAMNRLRVDTEDLDLHMNTSGRATNKDNASKGEMLVTSNESSSSPSSSPMSSINVMKYSIEEENQHDNNGGVSSAYGQLAQSDYHHDSEEDGGTEHHQLHQQHEDNIHTNNTFEIHNRAGAGAIDVDVDVDDDSDEEGLSRYTFEIDHDSFSHAYDSLHSSIRHDNHNANNNASPSTKSLLSSLKLSNLLQTHRQQLRRRRAERAISAPSNIRGRIMLVVSPFCDITERKGMLLIVLLMLLFVLLYYSLSFNAFYQNVIWKAGLVVLVVRILHRPMYWLIWGRVVEQRRLAAMRVYDGLNGEMATAGRHHAVAVEDLDFDGLHNLHDDGASHGDCDTIDHLDLVDGETGQIGVVV